MRKKLEGNGMWESSRMMLPEHKAAYVAHQQDLPRRQPPPLDEQEAERLSRLIAQSMQFRQPIVLALFQDGCETSVSGIVTGIDQRLKSVRFTAGDGHSWIGMSRIVGAELLDEP